MLEYLSNNYEVVTSTANVGTLLVWIFYAQLLYNSHRRMRLPRVLINKGVGLEYIDSPCLVCNMSQEPVFVYFMIVRLKTSDGIYTTPMTDLEGDELPESDVELGLRSKTRQGPLGTGEYLEFVTFRRMIERLLNSADIDIEDGYPLTAGVRLEWLEVNVVCIYGPEKKPFGAVRRFSIDAPQDGSQISLSPDTLNTKTRRSLAYRRQIDDWLRSHL